jgi:hypothetical protein
VTMEGSTPLVAGQVVGAVDVLRDAELHDFVRRARRP